MFEETVEKDIAFGLKNGSSDNEVQRRINEAILLPACLPIY